MTLTGTVWAAIGASPMSQSGRQDNGLTTTIAISPNDGNVIYQGTAGGGVWRSLDGGTTWTPIFDRQVALGVGEPGGVAIDPNDTSIIYVGTSNRVTPQAQAGLYKSTDGGASCIRLGSGYPAGNVGNATQFFTQTINVVLVDPANSLRLYLASSSGVFRSNDGGQNWTQGAGSTGDARALVLDSSSPAGTRILYAGITNRGVFRSNDGGQNWTLILGPATPQVVTAVGGTPGAGFSKVVVDIAPPTAPPNPGGVQVIYAALSGFGGAPDPVGLFMSTDQGATWTQRGAAGMPTNSQGGYSFHMAVDPGSPGDGANDRIFLGAVGEARSTDSGANFTALTGLHPDTHAWAFFRQTAPTPSVVYCGNDGGIFRSTDGGTTWISRNSGTLQTGLFYNLAVKPDATASVTLGALQDNGSQTTSGAVSPGWNSPQGGDGWDVAYDGQTANRAYCTSGFWPAPCTRLFFSNVDGTDFPSGVPSGQDITPWGTATDAGCYLSAVTTDPSAAGIIYASGNQNLWQSQDGGTTWRNIRAFPIPAGSFVSAIAAVAPTNGNNVVVVNGTQVFLSTNALAATVGPPNGVTFANITRALPNRNVLRAAFDPLDPTVIYCVLGGFNGGPGQSGHVFRTTVGSTAWQDISPTLDVPFGALALDGTDTPTSIYVGTDLGVLRSVDDGASWTILDDIHFPHAPVTDLVLSRQGGVLRAATYGRGVFEFRRPQWPSLAVNLQSGLDFGTPCTGPSYLTLQLFNVGTGDLVITSVQRLMGSTGFSVLPSPGTPLILAAGEEIDFTVQFTPTTPGSLETATIRIITNDPGAPIVDLTATGTGGVAAIETAIPDSGDFGNVCLGSLVDRELVINNRGPCPLRVLGIASSSAAFIPPGVAVYPLVVGAGDSVALPIRFQPTVLGPSGATLTITSSDPAGPRVVQVRGTAPAPRLSVAIANSGNFGDCCVGSFVDEPLTLNNSGRCALTITGISSDNPEFIPPGVDAYPLLVASGSATTVAIRFAPTSFGPKSATLTITSDDPTGPRILHLTGFAPAGRLAITGSTQFGGVELGVRVQQTLSLCNVGPCDLHVSRVAFKPLCGCEGEYDESHCHCEHRHRHEHPCTCDQRCSQYKLINNPFPATLRPGSCLAVVIQFTPRCETSRCCELLIESDDPDTPQKVLFVAGHMRRTLSSALKCWAAAELREWLDAERR